MKFIIGLLLIAAFYFSGVTAKAVTDSGTLQPGDSLPKGWSEIKFDSLGIINKMAYADTANFMHTKIYPCARCMLRPEVADALIKANEIANKKELKLVIFDCYRPYALQAKMYDAVPDSRYVAKPGTGSKHNRGAAVDLSLAKYDGEQLDMGGGFDDFSEVSKYGYKGLEKEQAENRKLLRDIMKQAGFEPYENEWWHFNYNKKLYDLSVYVWDCEENDSLQ